MGVISFSKYLKVHVHFRNSAENWEKVFCILDNCIWIGESKFTLIQKEYFSSAVSVLRSNPMTCDINKRDIF